MHAQTNTPILRYSGSNQQAGSKECPSRSCLVFHKTLRSPLVIGARMAESGRRIGNPLSLIVKDDCVLLRSSYAGASASGVS
jgi:hypothetical protein